MSSWCWWARYEWVCFHERGIHAYVLHERAIHEYVLTATKLHPPLSLDITMVTGQPIAWAHRNDTKSNLLLQKWFTTIKLFIIDSTTLKPPDASEMTIYSRLLYLFFDHDGWIQSRTSSAVPLFLRHEVPFSRMYKCPFFYSRCFLEKKQDGHPYLKILPAWFEEYCFSSEV